MDTNTYEIRGDRKNWLLAEDLPDEPELLHKELVYGIVGCAFEVIRELGHGLHEKPYENAMVIALRDHGYTYEQQRSYDVLFRGIKVSEYIPDLTVENAVVVETKVIDRITHHERGQMLNYLRITKLRVGVIANFKHRILEWERIVL